MTAGAVGPPAPVMPRGGTTNPQRNNPSARPVSGSLFKIDVGRHVAEIERVLRVGGDLIRCAEALEILERWQFDEMLDDASRNKARALVREFATGVGEAMLGCAEGPFGDLTRITAG